MNERRRLAHEAARILSDTPSPPLVEALELVAIEIDLCERAVGKSPAVRETKKKLGRLRRLAEEMASILSEPLFQDEFRDTLRGTGTLEKTLITPRRLRHLADDADWLIESQSSKQGTKVVTDHLGLSRGHFFCAAAMIRLWEIYKQRLPDNETNGAREVCVLLWEAAGRPITPAVTNGEVAAHSSWSRPIAEVRRAMKDNSHSDQAWWAVGRTNTILVQAGVLPDQNG